MSKYNSHSNKQPDTLAESIDVDPLPQDESGAWPVEYDGKAFYPIPESWLSHPNSYDRDGRGERLYAVSAAAHGGFIHVRYTHPTVPGVLVPQTNWLAYEDGHIPRALATTGWPRSITIYEKPQAYRERCETRHLVDLWSERSEEVQTDEEVQTLLADGGNPLEGL